MNSEKSEKDVFVFYSEPLQYKSIETKDGKKYYVEGYISTGDIDLVNDIVTKSCMDDMMNQFKDRTIKLDFEHEAFRGKDDTDAMFNKTRMPLGKAVDRYRDEKGLKVKWELNPSWKKFDEKGNLVMSFKDIWKNVEGGYYDAFSIAYVPTRAAHEQKDGKDIRLLDKVNLLNVALTGNPINPMASMTAVMAKSLEYLKDMDSKADYPWDQFDTVKSLIDSDELKNKAGENMESDKKKTDQDDQDDKKEKKADATATATEQKSQDNIEIKSRLEKIETTLKSMDEQMKAKDAEIKELKGVIEQARHKAMGAENKDNQQQTEVKSVGPLDML